MSILPNAQNWVRLLQKTRLEGRPFLHEQGNVVARGFVKSFQIDENRWTLTVRDVECLNKTTGAWEFDVSEDRYSGTVQYSYFSIDCDRPEHSFDAPFDLSFYGLYIYFGVKSEAPWSDNDWPELDTDMLSPGPMY